MAVVYSEYFKSVQGEGHYTGVPSIFIRLFGCNLTCPGFSNPENQDIGFDPDEYQNIEDMPIIEHGCDSRYSWAPEFRNFRHQDETQDLCDDIHSQWGPFKHPNSKQQTHLVITGGEPVLSQNAIAEIISEFSKQHNFPNYVTVETNGTRPLHEPFISTFQRLYSNNETEWLWSVSPKLSISGEAWEEAIKPDVLAAYAALSNKGQLKYVVDGSEQCWNEVEKATSAYRAVGVDWDVWIMPVGSTKEQQEEVQEAICIEAVDRGYNFSARVHSWVFGNKVGT
ncbi:MAG: 7-carboxy-7-deazaguanine synthase QueE [Rhodospirillaceae bacterium]|jgi:7-carboxy-7-deazaguanine synthase|nr:7-carboxy-7-deazaguanine synthase QueE [Rhodospirillaceae bacterium]MBT5245171.1 7-carboxy-7-deazaguanine synthase QueE [Rhodospirillaceae bacterium]MBT6241985.1 7-carboxy-7-deazaguanine synthase QueE [Rhodospirillaceae bacterium]